MRNVYIQATGGGGLTGLAYNTAGLTAYYFAAGALASVQIPLVTMSLGTWVSGGFVQVDATNMPGLYQLALPNAVMSGLAGAQSVTIILKGASGMAEYVEEMELTATNVQDNLRFGLTSLPAGPMMVKKNQAFANFPFLMVSAVDHYTPLPGLTVTSQVLLAGGSSFQPTTNSPTEIGGGWYQLNLSAADTNGTIVTLQFTAPGAQATGLIIPTQP